MNDLLNTIRKDQLKARKNKDKSLSSILTTLLGEAQMSGKNDGNRESTNDEVQKVIKKFIKNSSEMIKLLETFDPAYTKALYEKNILEKYLPKQLSEIDLKQIIILIVINNKYDNIKDIGKVMKELSLYESGNYDGKLASIIVKDVLNKEHYELHELNIDVSGSGC